GAGGGGDGLEVVAPDGQHAAVEVLALDLDGVEVAVQDLGLVVLDPFGAGEVDVDLPAAVLPGTAGAGVAVRGPIRPAGLGQVDLDVAGQELVDGNAVEAGQALEAGD